ncbi:hypothetical protein ACT3R7_11650 [Halomonas sp. AOP43-A1-21]
MRRDSERRALRLYGRSFYQVRKESGFREWGFMANLPREIGPHVLYDAVIATPLRWQILGIAYFDDGSGTLERAWCEVTTQEPLVAQGDQLVPCFEEALNGAKECGDSGFLYESALIVRPFKSQHAGVEPVLSRYKKRLGLSHEEVRQYSHGW